MTAEFDLEQLSIQQVAFILGLEYGTVCRRYRHECWPHDKVSGRPRFSLESLLVAYPVLKDNVKAFVERSSNPMHPVYPIDPGCIDRIGDLLRQVTSESGSEIRPNRTLRELANDPDKDNNLAVQSSILSILRNHGPCHIREIQARIGNRFSIRSVQREWTGLKERDILVRASSYGSGDTADAWFFWIAGEPMDEALLERKTTCHRAYVRATTTKEWTGQYAEDLFTRLFRSTRGYDIITTSANEKEQDDWFAGANVLDGARGYVDLLLTYGGVFIAVEIKNRGPAECWVKNDDLQRFVALADRARDAGFPVLFVYMARRIEEDAQQRMRQHSILYHETNKQYFHPDARALVEPAQDLFGFTFIECGQGGLRHQQRFIRQTLPDYLHNEWLPSALLAAI